MNENNIYYTVKDYSKRINKTEKTVYNWIKSGKIKKEKIKKVLNIILIKD